MAGQIAQVLRYLRGIVERGSECTTVDDAILLRRYATDRDESAFAALVERHGAMVQSVCRRLLRDPHAADDAFQATFLVLARRANSFEMRGTSLAGWLHGVAYRVALRARADLAVVNSREGHAMENDPLVRDPVWDNLREVLDEELQRLPRKLRDPVVLCYLEGKSHVEVAQELGAARGSVARLIENGCTILRQRLERRGLALSTASLFTLVAARQGSAISPVVLQALLETVRGHTLGAGRIALWADSVHRALNISRLRFTVLAIGLVLALVGAGAAAIQYAVTNVQPSVRASVFLHDEPVVGLAYSADGRTLAGLCLQSHIVLWDRQSGKEIRRLPTPGMVTNHIGFAFAPAGSTLALTTVDEPIRLWHGADLQPFLIGKVSFNTGYLAFSPDGSLIAAPGQEADSIGLWDVKSGKLAASFPGHQHATTCAAFSPDGTLFATTGRDLILRVRTVNNRKEIAEFRGEGLVQFADNTSLVVLADKTRALMLYKLGSETPAREFRGDADIYHHFAVSVDRRWLAAVGSSAEEGILRVWQIDDGKLVKTIRQEAMFWSVAFSPDGKDLAFCDEDKKIHLWPIDALLTN